MLETDVYINMKFKDACKAINLDEIQSYNKTKEINKNNILLSKINQKQIILLKSNQKQILLLKIDQEQILLFQIKNEINKLMK